MPGDATILEGPVTPAPIFAYRAIRSIFFASPDSSPEYHTNKENIIPTYMPSPAKHKSPTPKSPQLTPSQKRKRDGIVDGGAVLSPTKGILRTPGQATPRAKSLKDVSVKFKSISPEARIPDALVQGESSSKTDTKAAVDSEIDSTTTAQPVKSEKQAAHKQDTKSDTAASTYTFAPAALETYMAQTEKEMKRLVKYGQKMREYARKKDAENQELKEMIQELRRENERLRRQVSITGDSVAADDRNDVPTTRRDEQGKSSTRRESLMAKAVSPALRNKNRGHVRAEVDRVETTVRDHTLNFKDVKPQPQPLRSSSVAALTTASITSEEAPNPPSQRISSLPTTNTGAASTSTSSKIVSNLTSHKSDVAPSTSTPSAPGAASNTGTLRLAPERAAAARERLRLRAEARKASAAGPDPAGVSGVDKDLLPSGPGGSAPRRHSSQKAERESGKEVDEPSSVDWLNL